MTRQVKGPGTDVLKREYVYSSDNISITDLAEKHGLARSNVAQKALDGKWFQERQQFQRRLSEETRDALAEKWAEMQVAAYERLGKVAMSYLDKFEKALEADEIKVNTRDMLGIASMIRTLTGDMANKPVANPNPDGDPGDVFDGDAEAARSAIEQVKALLAGKTPEPEDE